jgi:hypothetical protein
MSRAKLLGRYLMTYFYRNPTIASAERYYLRKQLWRW